MNKEAESGSYRVKLLAQCKKKKQVIKRPFLTTKDKV